MDLLLATRNQHKSREFCELLGSDFKVIDLSSFPEIIIPEETGQTFEENARLKAIAASQDRHLWVIADDSGLEVEAFGGAPGIYSARYAGKNATDAENVEKLLRELRARNITGKKRSARFRCVVALAKSGKLVTTVTGEVAGTITKSPLGENGFGYDPIFLPKGFEGTFAESPSETKNAISHRAKAIAALREALGNIAN